jgi:hypothetical protein
MRHVVRNRRRLRKPAGGRRSIARRAPNDAGEIGFGRHGFAPSQQSGTEGRRLRPAPIFRCGQGPLSLTERDEVTSLLVECDEAAARETKMQPV